MKADFSRGFNPDRKRNREYRRVLLQQGRVLLDSDVAALVDANDRLLRNQAMDLGTVSGGHDRGYMITAGRLYATFRDLANVVDPPSGAALARHIDYTVRFRKRFPSLRLDTEVTGGGSVSIRLFEPHPRGQNIVLWLRKDPAVGPPYIPPAEEHFLRDENDNELHLAPGFSFSQLSDTEFRRFEFVVPSSTLDPIAAVVVHFDNSMIRRIFIAMIESARTAPEDSFWIHRGRFHVQGLMVENAQSVAYPDQAVPPPASGLVFDGKLAVAYLEGWERVVTAVHDPGIRERALSTGLDTSVRTEAIGQVKTFLVDASTTVQTLQNAFAAPLVPSGELVLSPVEAAAAASPCEIALEGGFTGRENHLYHFEVQSFDSETGNVRFKWSREGGAELFPVEQFEATAGATPEFNVFVKPELGLREGDIVEVLSDVIELGDVATAPASLSPDRRRFIPPRRLTGVLAVLKAISSGSGLDKFALRDFDSPEANVSPSTGLYPAGTSLRLRRWHAVITQSSPATAINIESGLQLAISGTFDVGDFWQFEARLTPNDGSVALTRHGPERLFSPLALLGPDPSGRPEVIEWLDEPFVSTSRISADLIHFDDAAARFTEFVDDDTNTLQAIIDHLLTKGVGRRIVDIITRVFDDGHIITGTWQLTVGDGSPGLSFGDFNGPDAIQQAIAFVRRQVVSNGDPWSLRLLVKRGTYLIDDESRITLGANESLTLEGEGTAATTAPTANIRPAAVIVCNTTGTNAALEAVGTGSRLELQDLTLLGGASGTTLGPGIARTSGEVHVNRCRIQNRTILLRASAETIQPRNSAVFVDSDLVSTTGASTTGSQQLRVEFPASGNLTCPEVLIDRCRIQVPVDNGFVAVTSASGPVRWEGLTMRRSKVMLAGSNTTITLTSTLVNSGILAVLTTGFPTAMLSIGNIVFEDCDVDAGSASLPGILLHLPAGNEPTGASVRSIDNVVIRGGKWTIRSDSMRNAAIYVGGNTFNTNATDSRIGNLVIERVEVGWSSTSSTLRYASTFNAGHALVLSASRVTIRDLSIFGAIALPGQGEVVVFGISRALIDGIHIDSIASGGGVPSGAPADRIRLYSSGTGFTACNINVVGSDSVASNGIVELRPAGTSSPVGRRTVLANCRVQQNDAGAGFFKENALDVDLNDCCAANCVVGLRATQQVVGSAPSMLTVRGGAFVNNASAGIWVSCASNLAAVTIDGTTCTGTSNGNGILVDIALVDLGSGLVPAFSDWSQRGPVVVNNRAFANGSVSTEQIRLGTELVNNIGGLCMGNFCRGPAGDGILKVLVPNTASGRYYMRGITAADVVPWTTRSRSEELQPENSPLAFNTAIWRSLV